MNNSKLAEMKKRLLDQQQNKDKNVPAPPKPQDSNSPVEVVIPEQKESPPDQNNPLQKKEEEEEKVNSKKDVQEVSEQSPEEEGELPESQHDAKMDEPEAQLIQKQGQEPQEQVISAAPLEILPAIPEVVPEKQQRVNEAENKQGQIVRNKSNQDAGNLEIQGKNISCSIDEQARPAPISVPLRQQPRQQPQQPLSKQQQKQRKVFLKEFALVNECIQNLRSSVKGLEHLEQKVKENPGLKERLKSYLLCLQEFQDSMERIAEE